MKFLINIVFFYYDSKISEVWKSPKFWQKVLETAKVKEQNYESGQNLIKLVLKTSPYATARHELGNCDIRFISQLSKFYDTKRNEIS